VRHKLASAGAAVAVLGAIALPALQAAPASAAARVGGVNVEQYCNWAWGYHAYVASWSAFGWRCNPVPGNAYYKGLDKGVDMNTACRLEYSTSKATAFAGYSDSGNPYSWSCYR
jgi:hypothetical protein